jgi:hypothetical protein
MRVESPMRKKNNYFVAFVLSRVALEGFYIIFVRAHKTLINHHFWISLSTFEVVSMPKHNNREYESLSSSFFLLDDDNNISPDINNNSNEKIRAIGDRHTGGPPYTYPSRSGGRSKFPAKLRQLLDESEIEGNQNIVSWLPHGGAFRVHKPKEFAAKIVGRYFNHGHYRSFTRQVRQK